MPECVTAGVLEHLWKWQPRSASVHFRLVCKSWQVAHDGLLRSIRIQGLASMPTTAAAWKRLSAVVSLQVDSSEGTTEVGLRSLAPLTALSSLSIVIARSRPVSDGGVVGVLAAHTGLTRLSLRGSVGVTDAGLRSLAPLTALTSLDVSVCRAITDAGLRSLAPLTALTSLDVSHCTGVTDDVMRMVPVDLLRFIRLSLIS